MLETHRAYIGHELGAARGAPRTARFVGCIVAACGVLLSATVSARVEHPNHAGAATQLPRANVPIRAATLANGLRVFTVEDHSAPVVTVALLYDVGSANEQAGQAEFAHLFEHLMFQGTRQIAPREHTRLVEEHGGLANAMTSVDWTLYFDTLPANQLDLALFLESDRLRGLVIDAQSLAREKEVVKEERRQRVGNQPYGRVQSQLRALLYDSFAYSREEDLSMKDLDAASLDDVGRFFATYYSPSNLVLVLVGDLSTRTALRKVERYFGDIVPGEKPARVNLAEPRQLEDRRRISVDPLAPAPRVSVAFKAVAGDHPDYFALVVLSSVLSEGHSSRLYRALVDAEGLATSVSGTMDERRGPGALSVDVTVRDASDVTAAEHAIYRQIEGVQRADVDDWELEKAKNSIATAYLHGLRRSVVRALYVGAYALDYNDPERVNTYVQRIAAVSKEDLRRVASSHLREGNRTVLVTLPKPGETSE